MRWMRGKAESHQGSPGWKSIYILYDYDYNVASIIINTYIFDEDLGVAYSILQW